MGAIWFDKGDLADHLHEIIGYKSGVAASIEKMCDLLTESHWADVIISSEKHRIRLRSEDYDSLYYSLLHKVGTTEKPYEGIFEILNLSRKFKELEGEQFSIDIFDIYHSHIKTEMELAVKEDRKSLDPTAMMKEACTRYGIKGMDALMEVIEEYERMRKYSPHAMGRWQEWSDIVNLNDLFSQYKPVVTEGEFFDQRFIDFLSVNQDKLGDIHWRKFEELISECFNKFGYEVELGPGTNDDGVDVRVWLDDKSTAPEYIIQCKRHKTKIDKVTIKGLYADVLHNEVNMGLLVTTSEFSVGAKKTVKARGYPIEEVNGDMVKQWLVELRTPGSGIVRV